MKVMVLLSERQRSTLLLDQVQEGNDGERMSSKAVIASPPLPGRGCSSD
jgi:hypothetical protein